MNSYIIIINIGRCKCFAYNDNSFKLRVFKFHLLMFYSIISIHTHPQVAKLIVAGLCLSKRVKKKYKSINKMVRIIICYSLYKGNIDKNKIA